MSSVIIQLLMFCDFRGFLSTKCHLEVAQVDAGRRGEGDSELDSFVLGIMWHIYIYMFDYSVYSIV